jgi:hypothetical protein
METGEIPTIEGQASGWVKIRSKDWAHQSQRLLGASSHSRRHEEGANLSRPN